MCDIADAIYITRFIFQGVALPLCFGACDHNGDDLVDIADMVYLVTYIFGGGPPPPEPFGVCDIDLPLDDLPCESFDACPDEM